MLQQGGDKQRSVTVPSVKPPEVCDSYHEHSFLDARDAEGDWRVGYVLERNEKARYFRVRFDGWQAKWDEVISFEIQTYFFSSPKLRHFRTMTLGYTGQKVHAAIRPGWKFDMKRHEENYQRICKFQQEPQQLTSPLAVTQLLRGSHYIYIDFLLSTMFEVPEEIDEAIRYLQNHLQLTQQFLIGLDTSFDKYYRSQECKEESIVVDRQAAWVCCFYELLDGCVSIFGGYQRLNAFYKDNRRLLAERLKLEEGAENLPTDEFIRRLYVSFMEECGLWEELKKLLDRLMNETHLVPFTFLRVLTAVFCQLDRLMNSEIVRPHSELLLQIFKRNFDRVTDKEIKDLDRSVISDVIQQLKPLYKSNGAHYKVVTQLEYIDLELSYRYFKSPYFQKKIKGLTSLKDQLELIGKGKEQLTPIDYFDWTMQNNFLQQVFGESMHPELLKRVYEVLKLFCEHRILTKQVLDMIWAAREGKHEAVVKTIDDTIVDLVNQMTSELVGYLFDLIKLQPLKNWDDSYLELVKRYSDVAVRSGKCYDNKFGLELIYEFATKRQDEKSLNAFFELLRLQTFDDELTQYRDICIEKIRMGLSSYLHVCLLLRIEKETNVSTYGKLDLIEVLVNDILRESKNLQQLPTRFSLLQTVLYYHQNLSLQPKQFDRLWDLFKVQSHPGAHLFMNWMCKPEDEEYRISQVLDEAIREYVFKEALCNHKKNDFIGLDLSQCEVFLCFMKSVNLYSAKLVKVKNTSVCLVNSQEMVGMPYLWQLFLNNKQQPVISRVADAICNYTIRLSARLLAEVGKQLTVKLVNKCLQLITTGSQKQNYRLVDNCVMLLLKLISKTEGKFEHTPTTRQLSAGSYDISVINTKTNERRSVNFNYTLPLGCLRSKIAKEFDTPVNAFQLTTKTNSIINFDIDQISFFDSGLSQPLYFTPIDPEPSIVKEEVNKHLDLLFTLLSTESSNVVWQLLSQLPISPQFKEKIEKAQNWQELISGGVYRELYILRVVESMDEVQWCLEFVEKGGVRTLLSKLRGQISLRNEVDADYLSTLTKLLLKYYREAPMEDDNEIRRRLSFDLVKTLSKVCIAIKARRQNTGKQPEASNERVEFEKSAADNIFQLLHTFKIGNNIDVLLILLESGHLELILSTGLVGTANRKFRETVCHNIAKLISDSEKVAEHEPEQVKQIMNVALTSTLNQAVEVQEGSNLLFMFCATLLDKLSIGIAKSILESLPNLLNKLCELVFSLPPEKSAREMSDVLWGVLYLLKAIVARTELNQQIEEGKLLQYLLEVCLFAMSPENKEPKCKTYKARLCAFRLVSTLMWLNPANFIRTLNFLSQFHLKGQWRGKRLNDWMITPKMNEKSATGYVGIKNLGCICYMNSFLQQMFMIPSFRQAVFSVEDPQFQKVKQQDNLLYQLKTLFIALQKSEQQYYNPRNFCHSFKDYQNKPINTSEQMDIDEFSGVIFDRLENQVKGVPGENFIKEHFGGIISNEIISKGCQHYSEREETFLSVPLEVKDKKNIYLSLETMIKGEMLEGENAYHCDRCNKKVPALKRMCLKRLPNHLILVLKRFEFNYETMAKNKINDHCEFPTELNLKDYSQQHLRSKEQQAKLDEDEVVLPDEYFSYELKGVVIHTGSADSGHYYSFIQKRGGRNEGWFEFNDTVVKKFDPENLAGQAFGGKEERYYEATLKEKTRNAYVLIYDRKQTFDAKGNRIQPLELQIDREETPYCRNFLKELKLENELTALHHLLFAREYQDFLNECIAEREHLQSTDRLQLFKYVTLFMFTRSIREKDKKTAFELASFIREEIKISHEFSAWLMDVFNDQPTLLEIIKNNPNKDMRKLLAGITVDVCRWAYPLEGEGVNNRLFETEENPDNPHPKTALANLINLILKSINEKYTASSNEFLMILTKLSLLGCEISDYLLEKRAVTLLLENYLEKDPATSTSGKMVFHVRPDRNIIGHANETDQKQSRYDILALNKVRMDFDKTYFWYLMTELMRHCDLKKKGSYPDLFYETKHLLEKEELSMIFLNHAVIYKALEDARNKQLMRKVVQYLVLLAIEDIKFSEEVMKCIGKALKVLESTKFRPFFILFKQLIAIPDNYQLRRFDGIAEIKIGLEENKKYYVEVNIIQQWLMKTIRKNTKLREYLRAEQNLVRSILGYLKDKQEPAEELARKNQPPCDRLLHMLHGVQLPKSASAYFDLTKMLTHDYSTVLTGEQSESKLGDPEWDSDDDLSDKPIKVGDTITVFLDCPHCTFEQAVILSEIYGHLQLKVKSRSDPLGIWKDDESLAPLHRIVNVDTLRRVMSGSHSDETASIDDDQGPHVI